MKKTILLVIAGLLMGSTLTFAAGALFFDVPADSWYRGAVSRLSDKGIVNGYPDGSFQGDNVVNRAEVAAMIDRAVQYSEDTKSASLSFAGAQDEAMNADVCVKEGSVATQGSYNPNSQTWWFDIETDSNPGCNPACVLYDKTKEAEVNWRCMGGLVQ